MIRTFEQYVNNRDEELTLEFTPMPAPNRQPQPAQGIQAMPDLNQPQTIQQVGQPMPAPNQQQQQQQPRPEQPQVARQGQSGSIEPTQQQLQQARPQTTQPPQATKGQFINGKFYPPGTSPENSNRQADNGQRFQQNVLGRRQ